MRRLLRLYPVMIVFTAVVIGLDMALGKLYNFPEPTSGLGYFANYFYVYLSDNHIPRLMPYPAFWSLSAEEHCYILFPLLFVLLKGNPERLIRALVGLCIACLSLRLGVAKIYPDYLNSSVFYVESHYRLDSIEFGVLLALTCQLARERRFLRLLTHPAATTSALLIVLACLLVRDPWFRETFRYTVLGCAITMLWNNLFLLLRRYLRSLQPRLVRQPIC